MGASLRSSGPPLPCEALSACGNSRDLSNETVESIMGIFLDTLYVLIYNVYVYIIIIYIYMYDYMYIYIYMYYAIHSRLYSDSYVYIYIFLHYFMIVAITGKDLIKNHCFVLLLAAMAFRLFQYGEPESPHGFESNFRGKSV